LHELIRVDGIGDWAKAIDNILIGSTADSLTSNIRDKEQKELTQRSGIDSWQYKSVHHLYECLEIFNVDINGKQSKVSARLWFSSFAQLRNRTRGHGASKSTPCSSACIPLEKSINLFLENFSLFKREWVYLYQNISGKYKVTGLSESTINFDFLKSSTDYNYQNGVYIYLDTIRHVELLKSYSEANDFYLPNGNFRNKTFEYLSYISDDRLQGDATPYLIPADNLPSSETEGLGALDIQGNCFTNLPPKQKVYVEREKLEEELKNILIEEDRFPVVTLVGRGGIGKTSLALSVLHKIKELKRFDLIIWFSSRDVDLLMEGPKHVKTQVLSDTDIAKEFVRLLEPSEEELKDKKPKEYFSNHLKGSDFGSILFVFDNFETVQNPIELFEWLNTYVRNPNKILITSRISRNFKADYPIEIGGMTDNECRQLIQIISFELKVDNLLNEDYINNLITESSGHPYIIKILLGELSKDSKTKKVQRIVAGKDEILTALFRRTYQTLSPAAKRIFLTLSSWRSVVPQLALESVLWRPENERMDIEGAIEELRKSSFIEVSTSEIDGSTFLSVPLAASFFGKSELEVSADKIIIQADRDLLMDFGAAKQTDVRNGFAPRIERKFKLVARKYSNGEAIESELPILEFIASKYPKAWKFLHEMYFEQSELKKAISMLKEYLKSNPSEDEKYNAWEKIAFIYQLQGNWDGESHALSEICLLQNTSFIKVSDVANRINNYYAEKSKDGVDIDNKEVIIKKIIDIMEKRIKSEGDATDYSRIAWLYMHLHNRDKAKKYVEEGLRLSDDNIYCQRLGEKLDIH